MTRRAIKLQWWLATLTFLPSSNHFSVPCNQQGWQNPTSPAGGHGATGCREVAARGALVVRGKHAHRLLMPCHELLHSFLQLLWIIFPNVIMPGLKVKGTFQVVAQPTGNGIGDDILYNVKSL